MDCNESWQAVSQVLINLFYNNHIYELSRVRKNNTKWFGILFFSCVITATEPNDIKQIEPINTKGAYPSYTQLKTWYSDKSNWPKIQTADGRDAVEMKTLTLIKPAPKKAMVELGEKLFFDPQLSLDKTVSCASCHEPRMNFGDRRKTAIGIENQEGTRNTPNIFGIDHWQSFFWDGRAVTAEQQALMPIENPIEMNFTASGAADRVNSDDSYRTLINNIGLNSLTPSQLAKAIVAFERTITLPDTKYSRFLEMSEHQSEQALEEFTEQELLGLHIFRTKAKCMTCHQGPLLSDNQFHVTGLHFYGRKFQDVGRFDATQKVDDSGKFRTASLLFVSHTAPWMHNGLFTDLSGIVNFYNNGGARPKPREHVKDDPLFPSTTPLLLKLDLTRAEIEAVAAFLQTL